jgi:hypothetical protein
MCLILANRYQQKYQLTKIHTVLYRLIARFSIPAGPISQGHDLQGDIGISILYAEIQQFNPRYRLPKLKYVLLNIYYSGLF